MVEAQARRQVRTFFDELRNGTRNYRTVASLSGQITQEYRGRCVLELLQNAHDALAGARQDDPKQISFVLTTEEQPELLIANSGRPFRREDFDGICQLGQSPKDPNESVGNKGLGFQSVLEVSTRPEIWSTAAAEGAPEFAFGFDPAGMRRLVEQAAAELERGPSAPQATTGRRIINWSQEQLLDYQTRDRSGGAVDATREARSYLSPYSIPLSIEETPPEVAELLGAGHVTVIRLRIDGGRTRAVDEAIADPDQASAATADQRLAVNEAIEAIKDQLDELDARSTVFLQDLERLTIDVDGERRVLERIVDSPAPTPISRSSSEQVLLVGEQRPGAPDDTTREFRVWTRGFGGDGDPAEARRIQEAVKHLPNRWPKVRQVEVGVAVEDTESPEPGAFVIFLPTEVPTGTGTLINAPFYGSLDRRQVNFEDEYNALLLEYVMDLTLDVVAELVAGPAEVWRARAIVDLLASAGQTSSDDQPTLMHQMCQRSEDTQQDVATAALLLCDNGWRRAESARIMPDVPGDGPLSADRWRESAAFDVVSSGLDERRKEAEALLGCLGGSATPTPAEWANTVERLAERTQRGEIDVSWDAFLSGLLVALPRELRSPQGKDDPLAEAKFLPTQDGRLLRASDSVSLFFAPRRGIDDAADLVDTVPDALKPRIAFLHQQIRTYEGRPPRNTEIQKFLSGRFVQGFRREDLLEKVVVPAVPALPVAHDRPEARDCSQILQWSLVLVGGVGPDAQEDLSEPRATSNLIPLLHNLPVACGGGWFAISAAIFGPGWTGKHGADVETLVAELTATGHEPACEAAKQRSATSLLPPEDRRWGDAATEGAAVAERGRLLQSAGVVDGLRLRTDRSRSFRMSASEKNLPREAPGSTPPDRWGSWCRAAQEEVRPEYVSWFDYQLSGVQLLPELDFLADLAPPGRRALSELILASLPDWPKQWDQVRISKTEGAAWATVTRSPLQHWLAKLPWLVDDQDGRARVRPLNERWLVPESLLQGQQGRFSHLSALPMQLARRLGENPHLLATLKRLGLNVYPTEEDRTGPELLEALATAWDRGVLPAGGFDVFLGQVRHAWNRLDPNAELPRRFLARTNARSFKVKSPEELTNVYLPDHNTRNRSLRDHLKPILEMLLAEARGAIGRRLDELGLRRASNLRERCLVDGMPLSGDATAGAVSIEDTELSWLPLVLLTLAAHGGTNPRGAETEPWRDAMTRLRGTLVRRCCSLAVELTDGDQVVGRSEPQAHWLSEERLFLLCHGASYVELAPASQALLQRQDLLKDLRLVMGSLGDAAPEPTRQQIEAALDGAEIDSEAVADVRRRWFDATALLVDRIRPVLRLLGLADAGLETAASDVKGLREWLSRRLPEGQTARWSPEDLVSAAKRSKDDEEMGREAFRRLGEMAQIPAWNDALTELGESYTTVVNDEAGEQAKRHIEEAAPLLRSLARHVAAERNDADLFLKMEASRRDFETPVEWSACWWEVPLGAVLRELRAAYVDDLAVESGPASTDNPPANSVEVPEQRVGVDRVAPAAGVVDALDHATTLADLRQALGKRGVALDVDPFETFRRNRRLFRKEIDRVRDLHRAWREISGAEPAPLRNEATEAPRTDSSAYLRAWSPVEIFGKALETVDDAEFEKRCRRCRTVEMARTTLGVTPEALQEAARRKLRKQQEQERANRTFEIAGKPFEIDGQETYGDLLARLDNLPAPEGPDIERDESSRLVQPPPIRRNQKPPRSPGRTSHLHASPHLPGLVGIVGEIHAYRYLRSKFGSDVVTPAAWVSENGLKVVHEADGEKRDASDSRGFDFRFVSDGIAWHFEVKATTGDDTTFSLPPSEIGAATELANSDSDHDRWRILRVRQALSNNPQVDLLPNPFETGFSSLFRIGRSGLTVRYELDVDA